jgi:hypothetical protein
MQKDAGTMTLALEAKSWKKERPMSWLKDSRSSKRRFRNYVCSDLRERAPAALRSLERDVPPHLLDAAFAFAWDHHQEAWSGARSVKDFDRVAQESAETVMHYIVSATRPDLLAAPDGETAGPRAERLQWSCGGQ